MAATATTPAISVVPAKTGDGWYYEAFWRVYRDGHKPKPVKRRLGKAWVVADGDGWKKAPGRTPDGYLDPKTVHVTAAEKVTEYLDSLETGPEPGEWPTLRTVAWEWYEWKRDVKGATPKTLEGDFYLLAEPGTPMKRPQKDGKTTLDGRIMAEFGDDPLDKITSKRFSEWLKKLDKAGLKPRNVNKHRSTVSAIYSYAMKVDTHAYPLNPVAPTDKRPEPPKRDVEVYEWDELEAIARQLEGGTWRKPQTTYELPVQEIYLRKLEDQQDADLVRIAILCGLRLGEIRGARIGDFYLNPDMSGGLILVRKRVSAGVIIDGSKWDVDGRKVPIPEAAARVFARHLHRLAERFGEEPKPGSLVFCSRRRGLLSETALRRRYTTSCEKAGVRVLRLHDLRHAAGTHVGRTEEATFVRDFLGHTKTSTTDRYTHSKLATMGVAAMNRAFASANKSMRGTDA